MAITAFAPTSQAAGENSQLAPYFLVVGRAAIWAGPAPLRARFFQGLDLLHQAPQNLGVKPAAGRSRPSCSNNSAANLGKQVW